MKTTLKIISTFVACFVLISTFGFAFSLFAEEIDIPNTREASTTPINIPNGTYFLRNKQVTYYADIQGPTMASGTEIHQWTFNGNNSQKWIFTSVGSGYYTIKSANSSSAYYLGVENDSNTQNANIVLRTGTITNGMKWKITLTDSGAYRITPKTGDWALATSTSDKTTGNKLIQGAYVDNDSYRDEWTIISPLTPILYGIPDTTPDENHNHHSALNNIKNMGGWGSYSLSTVSLSSASIYKTALTQGDIFIGRGHGGRLEHDFYLIYNYLLLSDLYTAEERVRLYSSYYSDLSANSSYLGSQSGETYSNLKLAIFVSCYSACGGRSEAQNITNNIVDYGAETAVGFIESIGCNEANEWVIEYWNAMLSNESALGAKYIACNSSGIYSGDVLVAGNENLKITV